MRLDARIPVLTLPWPHGPADAAALPGPDPLAVLLLARLQSPADLAADRADHLPPGYSDGWAATCGVPIVADTTLAHAAACACCAGRTPLALLLSELFVQRARGRLALFRRVLVIASEPASAAVRDVLATDPLVAGRYRAVPAFVED